MAFCENCGMSLPYGAANCPSCGAKADYNVPVTPAPPPKQPTPPPPPPPPPSKLILAEKEEIVRQYRCCSVKRPRLVGNLTVTNKRVIYHGSAVASRIDMEVSLDSVSGLQCYYGTNVSILGIILGAIAAISGFTMMGNSFFAGLIVALLGGYIIYRSVRKSFSLAIYSSKANGSPISVGLGPLNLIGSGALHTLTCSPTAETDRMLNELGALIQDLQTLGDHAIQKWRR